MNRTKETITSATEQMQTTVQTKEDLTALIKRNTLAYGAQNQEECRSLIKQFNLLNVNRR